MKCYSPVVMSDEDTGACCKVPCGKCYQCRKVRAEEWAYRIVDESRYHKENSFVTLTYDEKHEPKISVRYGENYPVVKVGVLSKRDVQLFIKRVRKRYDNKIKYYMVGEYGDISLRPPDRDF